MWHALTNTVFHLTKGKVRKLSDGTWQEKDICDWTILIQRNGHHTTEEAEALAKRIATLLKHGQAMLAIVEGCAVAGELQFETSAEIMTHNPCDLIIEMREMMDTKDNDEMRFDDE